MSYFRYRQRTPDLVPLYYLLGANVLLFVLSLASPNVIVDYGLVPGDVLARPWTLLTSIFLHASFTHIFANMITLFFFGMAVIELTGSAVFLAVYFVGGLVGGLFYVALAPSFSLAIGASGAVFALGGTLVALVPKRTVVIFPIPVPMPLWVAVIGGFVVISFLPRVAWQAHLGGLLTGLVWGYIVKRKGS